MDNWMKRTPKNQLSIVRVGLFEDWSPPFTYNCSADFLTRFADCTKSTNFSLDCTLLAKPCHSLSPGPGVFVELLATMLLVIQAPLVLHVFPKGFTYEERLQFLKNATIDVLADGIDMTSQRFETVRFTPAPFPPGTFSVILREDSLYVNPQAHGLGAILSPFNREVWAALALGFLMCTFMFCAADVLVNGRTSACLGRSVWRAFVHLSLENLEVPLKYQLIRRATSVKATIILWSVLCYLLQSLYSGSITSNLAQSVQPIKRFSTMEEAAELIMLGEYKFADYTDSGAFYELLRAAREGTAERKMFDAIRAKGMTIFNNTAAAVNAILHDGRILFKGDQGTQGTFAALSYAPMACSALTLVEFDGESRWCGFAVNPNRKKLHERLSRLVEMLYPIRDMLMEKYNMRGDCKSVTMDIKVDLKPLSLQASLGTFIWLLIGLLFTIVAFLAERFTHCFEKKIPPELP